MSFKSGLGLFSMAPWCPACRAFQETWDGFAKKWSRDLDIQVGVVDVTASPGLSGRFLITALPSIYQYVADTFLTLSLPPVITNCSVFSTIKVCSNNSGTILHLFCMHL